MDANMIMRKVCYFLAYSTQVVQCATIENTIQKNCKYKTETKYVLQSIKLWALLMEILNQTSYWEISITHINICDFIDDCKSFYASTTFIFVKRIKNVFFV